MFPKITRRRFMAVTAGAAPRSPPAPAQAAVQLHVWEGTALGARASLRLYHPDPAAAARLIEACRRAIARLEQVFSLYRPDSAVSRLNAEGASPRHRSTSCGCSTKVVGSAPSPTAPST
jgi:thiamine biosynthesis lipoprotein